MTTIQTIHQYRCDLSKGPSEVNLKTPIMHQDALGDVFRVSVWNGSKSVSLTGMTVRGYLYFSTTRQTLLVDGSIVDGFASVALTSECYAIPGYASLVVQVQDGSVRHSLLKVNMNIARTCSDSVIDPGNVLPTLPELLGQISAMEQATDKANATIATIKADTAAAIEVTNEATVAARTATVELAKTAAPAITPTATGEIVAVSDSAERPLAGLRLYGKTTQDGTPTPDAPVPLVSVGDGGSITARVCSKNLMTMPNQSFAYNGVTFAVNADGSISVSGASTSTVNYYFYSRSVSIEYGFYLPAGTYVMSFRDANGNAVGSGGFGAYYWLESNPGARQIVQIGSNNTSLTFTLTEGAHVQPTFYFGLNAVTNKTVYCQIERGSAATAWEAIKDGGSVTVSTPNGMPGIPVSSGGNYTDASGQQWICDEKDYKRGVYVQRVNKLTYDSSNGSIIGTMPTITSGKNRFHLANDAASSNNANIGACLCTLAQPMSASNTYMCTEGIAIDDINRLNVYIDEIAGMTISDALAWMKAKSMQVIYGLATPIETALSAEDLAAYGELTSQYPHTTVCNDAGAGMQVDYIADTQLYIDKKLAAIAAASL